MANWNLIRASFSVLLNTMPIGNIVGVEIGVDKGENAKLMLENCSRINLILVDIVEQPQMVEVIKPYLDRVEFIKDASVNAAKRFPDNHFDYIYIDGDHSYKGVGEDIEAWYPKIKTGGIFAGHDFWMTEVQQALKEFCLKNPQPLYAVQRLYQTYMIPQADAEFMDWWLKKYD